MEWDRKPDEQGIPTLPSKEVWDMAMAQRARIEGRLIYGVGLHSSLLVKEEDKQGIEVVMTASFALAPPIP